MRPDWEEVTACPLCGAEQSEFYPVTMPPPVLYVKIDDIDFPATFSVAYQRCVSCGLIYQTPRFTDDARNRFYAGGTYRRLTESDDHTREIERAERLAELIKPLNVKSIFDIGCGRGDFLIACAKMGVKDVAGIDLRDEYILSGVPKKMGNRADLISMIHVLEHTTEPVKELQAAMAYSKRYILVEVPHNEEGGWAMYLPHTLIFKPWVLVSAIERAGWTIVGLGVDHQNITVIGER